VQLQYGPREACRRWEAIFVNSSCYRTVGRRLQIMVISGMVILLRLPGERRKGGGGGAELATSRHVREAVRRKIRAPLLTTKTTNLGKTGVQPAHVRPSLKSVAALFHGKHIFPAPHNMRLASHWIASARLMCLAPWPRAYLDMIGRSDTKEQSQISIPGASAGRGSLIPIGGTRNSIMQLSEVAVRAPSLDPAV
jgi:hypothetical protein